MAIDDPVAFAPPPSFGPFRVLHQIGIGALGPVFRTYEPTRDRLVAVKVFRLDITPEQSQALARELARASDAGLFHPSIVEPIAAGVEGTVAYRAEEYVAAESLDAAIRHYAPAALDTTLPFLTQLAGAIDFARTAGIGHGALHLRDIFVTPEESRASGFGVVEALERVGLRAPVRRPYSAPERIAGGEWSTPADVFSLAAITYELLTGRRPSGTGDQMGPLAGGHLLEFGAGMRAVLARAMDDDPARRYATALAFASALEAAARGGRVSEAVAAVSATGAAAAAPAVVPPPAAPSPEGGHDDEDRALPEDEADVGDPEADFDRDFDLPLAAGAGVYDGPTEIGDIDDIATERDEDAAYVALTRDTISRSDRERSLFDDEQEAAAPEPAPSRVSGEPSAERSRFGQRLDAAVVEDTREAAHQGASYAADVERPRPAVLPIALTLILGLMVGFAAGYWTGGRTPVPAAAPTSPAASAPAANAPRQPATGAPVPKAGQAYSEQAVAAPPAIPADEPSPSGEPSRSGEPSPRGAAGRNANAGAGDGTGSPAAPRPVASATGGRLVVSSTPSRAAVTVDGRWRGRTPLTLDRLRLKTYSLRVVAPGFVVERDTVTLTEEKPSQTVSLRLTRAPAAAPVARGRTAPPAADDREPARSTVSGPFAGALYVDSRPRGARILIDGRAVGTTPARIPDISIGSHVVRLELAEHRAWTTSTRVAAGEESRVTGSLERIP